MDHASVDNRDRNRSGGAYYEKVPMRIFGPVLAALAFSASSPAWAVYPQKVELIGEDAEEIPTASIRFEANDGSQVIVEDDDDNGTIALIFPNDRSVPGDLVIVSPDGTSTRIAVPAAGPGEKILIDLPRRSARAVPDRPGPSASATPGEKPKVTISLFGGAMDSQVPEVGAGTVVDGGSEDFAALLDDSLTVPFGGGSIAFEVGGGSLELFGGFGEASDQASSSIAAGGAVDVAIAYTDFSPAGSTGLFLGNVGLDTVIDRDVDVLKLGGVFTVPLGSASPEGGQVNGRIGVEYKRVRQDIDAWVMSPSFGMDITANYRQRSSDKNLSLILGAEYRQQVAGGFYFAFGADGMLINRNADLNSVQDIVCMVCAAPEDAFTITVTDDDSGVTFGGRANAEIGFDIGGNVSLGVLGFAEYVDKVTQIANPRNGDDLFVRMQPTQIGSRSATNFGGALVLRVGL